MRTPNRSGIGLTILVAIIAVLGLVLMVSVRAFENTQRQTQLRIDQTKAHYLAQAGVMRAIWKWYTNNDVAVTNEIQRRWTPINTTVTGNNLFKVGSDSAGSYLQSNYAYVVPGIAFVKNIATGTSNTAGLNVTATTAGTTVPVGDFVVVSLAMDGGVTTAIGCSDNGAPSNTYTQQANIVGPPSGTNTAATVRTLIFSAPVTTAMAAGRVITCSWTVNNVTAKAMSVAQYSGVDTFDAQNTGTNTQSAGPTNPPLTAAMTANFANELLVGAVGVEGTSTEVVTPGTDWINTPPTRIGIGSTTSGAVITPMYRIISTAGNYTAGGTNSANRDWSAAIAGFYAPNRWFTSGANRRLQQWQIYNTHNASNITLDKVKISWSPAGAELLNDFVLNGVSKWPGGTAASGSTIDLTNTALASGAAWQGSSTYIQWNGAVNAGGNVTVTCQFIFSGDTATSDDKTGEIVMWNGAQTNGAGMPTARAFTVTATGQVNQNVGGNFKVMKSIKATVSGDPATSAAPAVPVMEITDWDEEDQNIP